MTLSNGLLIKNDFIEANEFNPIEAFQTSGSYLKHDPLVIYKESTENELSFNVMPGRMVKEKLFIKEYRIWNQYIEAEFDRNYLSQMKKSPDHLIFLSVLVHLQKLMYVYVSHHLGFKYDPYAVEKIKFWPTDVNIKMPGMVRKKNKLVHKMLIEKIEEEPLSGGHSLTIKSQVEGIIHIQGKCPFFLVGE